MTRKQVRRVKSRNAKCEIFCLKDLCEMAIKIAHLENEASIYWHVSRGRTFSFDAQQPAINCFYLAGGLQMITGTCMYIQLPHAVDFDFNWVPFKVYFQLPTSG
jgi:hypothetical protein